MPDHAFPEESAQSVLLTLAHLKKRGWTPALITRFLPEPDSIKQNPYYRRGAPMRLYQQARVEAIEATPEFREAQQRAARRSISAKASAQRRAEALIAQARVTPITVRRVPLDQLQHAAIQAFNTRQVERSLEGRYDYLPASKDSDSGFLRRIMVNFVRHELANYDHCLAELAGKAGVREAVRVIRARVYAAIAEAYPMLREECERQEAERRSKEQEL